MGWIRIGKPGAGPAKQLHNLAANVEVVNKAALDQACRERSKADLEQDETYPILARKTKDRDLPFIPSVEIMKRDGKDVRRLWIVVDGIVLDCTTYICTHPGGQQIVKGFGGQDCSWQWWTFHNRKVWNDVAITLRVGRTEGIENRHVKPQAFVGLRGFGYQDDA